MVIRGAKKVRNGLCNQNQSSTVLPALLFSAQAAGQLFSLSPEIIRAKTAAVNTLKLFAFKPDIIRCDSDLGLHHEKLTPSTLPNKTRLTEKSKILFRDISFSRSTKSAKPALQKVSFTIEAGETVAFVGPSALDCRPRSAH